jgi:hypothetical protein
MRALVFGKPATPRVPQGRPSLSLEWQDSDSSVDSVHSSPVGSPEDPDWPTSPGYEKLDDPPRDFANTLSLPTSVSHSASFSTSRKLFKPRSLSLAATLSPKLIARFKRRPTSVSQPLDQIAMPITPPQKKGGPRSPGSALPAFDSVVRPGGLLVVKDAGEKRAGVFAGQLAVVRDSSGGDDLRVTLLTGLEVGQAVSLPRRQLELYTAPVSRQLISATYSLGRELGRGRFSKVHKAKHKGTGGRLAVKIVMPEVREEAFEHELCTVFHFNHPNIARCLGGVVNHRERALVFELVEGRGLLEHLVHKGKVTDADVAGLLCQLLKALVYLHARSVCHLDCRPPNVLVQVTDNTERVKLTDFGAARHFGCSHQMLPLEHAYESPASYHYLAPEAFQQQPLAAPADIWTVGVVTFIIFHGKFPFVGDTEAAKVLRGALVLPNEGTCSQNVRSFIKATLTQDPFMRPSAAAAATSKWFKEDHSAAGTGPWLVNNSLIKHFLSNDKS